MLRLVELELVLKNALAGQHRVEGTVFSYRIGKGRKVDRVREIPWGDVTDGDLVDLDQRESLWTRKTGLRYSWSNGSGSYILAGFGFEVPYVKPGASEVNHCGNPSLGGYCLPLSIWPPYELLNFFGVEFRKGLMGGGS